MHSTRNDVSYTGIGLRLWHNEYESNDSASIPTLWYMYLMHDQTLQVGTDHSLTVSFVFMKVSPFMYTTIIHVGDICPSDQ